MEAFSDCWRTNRAGKTMTVNPHERRRVLKDLRVAH